MLSAKFVIQNVAIIKGFLIFIICFRIQLYFYSHFTYILDFKFSEIFISRLLIRTRILSFITVMRRKMLNIRSFVFIYFLYYQRAAIL